MSTAPVKSKNLHNFPLPFLKWAHKNSTHRHRSSLSDSSHNNPSSQPDSDDPNQEPEAAAAADKADDSSAKPRNLRPRKSVSAQTSPFGSNEPPVETEKSQQLKNLEGGVHKSERREKKMKLWISLTKEEIEEDLYSMSGSKPARRPKKRTKTVQKQLDNVFPGLYLDGTAVDSYRVQYLS